MQLALDIGYGLLQRWRKRFILKGYHYYPNEHKQRNVIVQWFFPEEKFFREKFEENILKKVCLFLKEFLNVKILIIIYIYEISIEDYFVFAYSSSLFS